MTDIPIIFSAPMVRALLEGRKTMTRRVIKKARVFATPERPAWTLRGEDLTRALQNADRFRLLDGDGWFWEADAFEWQAPHTRTGWMAHIGYAPSDRLWVRETVACGACAPSAPSTWSPGFWRREQGSPDNLNGLWYRADGLKPRAPITERGKWVPAIHMPRWASRITLAVTGVKVVRLYDIGDDDIRAEGIQDTDTSWLNAWRQLWESINGPGDWEANPWVVAISFRVIKANIDAPEAMAA